MLVTQGDIGEKGPESRDSSPDTLWRSSGCSRLISLMITAFSSLNCSSSAPASAPSWSTRTYSAKSCRSSGSLGPLWVDIRHNSAWSSNTLDSVRPTTETALLADMLSVPRKCMTPCFLTNTPCSKRATVLTHLLDRNHVREPLSVWKSPRYLRSLSRLLTRMVTIAGVLFGFATNTCTRCQTLENFPSNALGLLFQAQAGVCAPATRLATLGQKPLVQMRRCTQPNPDSHPQLPSVTDGKLICADVCPALPVARSPSRHRCLSRLPGMGSGACASSNDSGLS